MCKLRLTTLLFLIASNLMACSRTANSNSAHVHSSDEAHSMLPIESPEKETVRLTESGFEPPMVVLKKMDGSVFFVNTTTAGLATLEVDFGNRRAHCASENMKYQDGRMVSVRPVGPRDFALMCFPEKGSYEVVVRGLDGTTKPYHAQVIVE